MPVSTRARVKTRFEWGRATRFEEPCRHERRANICYFAMILRSML
ncbi:hypothetical protein CKA32_004452 [Geitlerinema sp. FC II]|nr:hypothetical protein CKA32_004452 [Geitlerinema sp. FC II]